MWEYTSAEGEEELGEEGGGGEVGLELVVDESGGSEGGWDGVVSGLFFWFGFCFVVECGGEGRGLRRVVSVL